MPRISFISWMFERIPGKRVFGIYRFLPFFFVFGALLEYSMINWKPNGVNFYAIYKDKRVDKEARRQLEFEKLRDMVFTANKDIRD